MAAMMVLLLGWRPALGEGSRAQIAKAGKAATAFVKCTFTGSQGSAFCVHSSGIFVTNEHVVRQEMLQMKPSISLVLNPGLNTAKVLQAKVLRVDAQLDLALLQVQGQKDLPMVPLGSIDNLSETDEVIAFGFPFGQNLAANPRDYPAISVNVGKVTSLRTKDGALHQIQLDAALNPGNSGGPVLDKDGKVVGVVVSGFRGSGVNFAIPVSHVTRFVARPEILFDPPALKMATIHEPMQFVARALRLVPSREAMDLELVIQMENRESRKFKMEGKDGVYRITAAPVLAPKKATPLRLTALYPQGLINGEVGNRVIKVGGTTVELSEVRRLVAGDRPRVWLHNGKLLRGALTGVDAIVMQLGSTRLDLDLTKTTEVRLQPPSGIRSLTATIVVKQATKEVGRVMRFLAVEGLAETNEDEVFVDLDVAPLGKDVVTLEMKAPIKDVAVGGGGRYLILHLPKEKQLAVFDVNEAKVVKALPAPDANVKFTAGLDKLLIALPGSGTLERWSLKTFERELAVPYPIKGEILALSMGAASQGPAVVYAKEGTSVWTVNFLLDLRKLARREIGWSQTGNRQVITTQAALHVRSSPDGKSTGVWCTAQSPTGVTWIRWQNQVGQSTYSHSSNGHVIPGPRANVLFTGMGMFTALGQIPNQSKTYPGTSPTGRYLPAYDPDYYLYLGVAPTFQNRNPPRVFEIHKFGVDGPVLRLSNIEMPATNDMASRDDFTLDKRFHFLPQAKVLIVIPSSNDRLVLHRVDVEEALKKMARDKK
jgi:hypothetical protein